MADIRFGPAGIPETASFEEAMAELGTTSLANKVTGDGTSFVGGNVSAISINSDMNANAGITST